MPYSVKGFFFFKSVKKCYRFCWCWRYFSHRILRLKICSVVLLPALNPACSSAIIFSAWGLSLFKITFSMTVTITLCKLSVLPCIKTGLFPYGKAAFLRIFGKYAVNILRIALFAVIVTSCREYPANNSGLTTK